ncbi:Alpha/Beta hydrolase protein [Poronia punctata]|nr:Alpha/Beta hydrolase protein [Poronia punctata]
MLPQPSLSFTLPSIHDKTRLKCRVYHPDPPQQQPFKHAAVVAHPYAPMGGCYNDPIVDLVAGTLVQLGFVVATFNFRGATSSEGRTSWTAKPEQGDYISVVGFLAYYLYYLSSSSPPPPPPLPSNDDDDDDDDIQPKSKPTMLLAGYSYGAMIMTRIPPLETILGYFATPGIHSAEADIRFRAQHLAAEEARNLGSIRFGDAGEPRKRSSFQREERIQKSVRDLLAPHKTKTGRGTGTGTGTGTGNCLEEIKGIAFRSAYIAVSLPVGLMTRLATLSLGSTPMEFEGKFVENPTLVVYGDQDGFISHRRMRLWINALKKRNGGEKVRCVEVKGAGHFWVEHEAVFILRDAVGNFAMELIRAE